MHVIIQDKNKNNLAAQSTGDSVSSNALNKRLFPPTLAIIKTEPPSDVKKHNGPFNCQLPKGKLNTFYIFSDFHLQLVKIVAADIALLLVSKSFGLRNIYV